MILIHSSFICPTLSVYFSISLCRELNEINRKHIQDSVALILEVRMNSSRRSNSYLQQALRNGQLPALHHIFCRCHQLYSTPLTHYLLSSLAVPKIFNSPLLHTDFHPKSSIFVPTSPVFPGQHLSNLPTLPFLPPLFPY